MKNWLLKNSKYFILTALLGLTNYAAFAAGSDESNAWDSDTKLLVMMLSFILVLLITVLVLASAIKSLGNNKELWKKKFDKTAAVLLIGSMLSFPSESFAAGNNLLYIMSNQTFYLLLTAIIFLFGLSIFLGSTLRSLLNELSDKKEEESVIAQLASNLTEAVPIEREEEVMTDHEYDGIRELDNVLPPWWVYMFYITIVFGIVYMSYYHIAGSGDIMEEEYLAMVEEAEQKKKAKAAANPGSIIDENTVEQLLASADLERGRTIFNANCASCHLESGGGNLGPNLTDEYWIHGGGIKNIFTTIKYGVPEKGMISWEALIKPADMQKVASYVMSLSGTNPSDGKAPEGEKYIPEETASAMTLDTLAVNTADDQE